MEGGREGSTNASLVRSDPVWSGLLWSGLVRQDKVGCARHVYTYDVVWCCQRVLTSERFPKWQPASESPSPS